MLTHIPGHAPTFTCANCGETKPNRAALHAHWLAWHNGPQPMPLPDSRIPDLVLPQEESDAR